jgi:hypothetical protein
LSSIPAGYTSANIAKASLKLFASSITTAGNFNVNFVNGTWSEKTITSGLSPALGTTIAGNVPLTRSQQGTYAIRSKEPGGEIPRPTRFSPNSKPSISYCRTSKILALLLLPPPLLRQHLLTK